MSNAYTGQYSVLNQYTPLTQKYGAEYGVDPTLLDALIWRESGGNKMATNGSAMGLTQFTPVAMAQYGVANPYDPAQSIKGAAEYLSDYSSAGVTGALQAYNAGAPGKTTETVGGVPYEDAVISTAQSLEAQSGAAAPAGSLSAGAASETPGSSAGSLSAGVASQAPGSSTGSLSAGVASQTPGTTNSTGSTSLGQSISSMLGGSTNGQSSTASSFESGVASWIGGTIGAVLVVEMIQGSLGDSAGVSTGEIAIAAVIGAVIVWGVPNVSGTISEWWKALTGGAEKAVGNAVGTAASAVSTDLGDSSMKGYAGFDQGGSAAENSIWAEYLGLMDRQLGLTPQDWMGYVPSISGSGSGSGGTK